MNSSLTDQHPWKSSWDEFEQVVLPVLREHGKQIGAAARSGADQRAQGILDIYALLESSFDPVTHMRLMDALLDYMPDKVTWKTKKL